jgi:hypothetical protein
MEREWISAAYYNQLARNILEKAGSGSNREDAIIEWGIKCVIADDRWFGGSNWGHAKPISILAAVEQATLTQTDAKKLDAFMLFYLREWVIQEGNHSNATLTRELLQLGGETRKGVRERILQRIAQELVSQMSVEAVPVAEAPMAGGAQEAARGGGAQAASVAASAAAQPTAVGAAVEEGTSSSSSDEDDSLHPGSEFTLRF